MIDVHPPEHGIHGWRDFLTHMATIVLGLMIALGLEQSAEWLHHRHQLSELHQGLRQETEGNMKNAQIDWANEHADSIWLRERIGQLAEALRSQAPVGPEPPLPKSAPDQNPADPAWSAAKFGGLLAIVPQDEIQVYSEVDSIIADRNIAVHNADAAESKKRVFEISFCDPGCKGPPDFSHATPADLREYIRLLEDSNWQLESVANSDHWLYGAENAILHGERNIGRVQAAEDEPMPTSAAPGSK